MREIGIKPKNLTIYYGFEIWFVIWNFGQCIETKDKLLFHFTESCVIDKFRVSTIQNLKKITLWKLPLAICWWLKAKLMELPIISNRDRWDILAAAVVWWGNWNNERDKIVKCDRCQTQGQIYVKVEIVM